MNRSSVLLSVNLSAAYDRRLRVTYRALICHILRGRHRGGKLRFRDATLSPQFPRKYLSAFYLMVVFVAGAYEFAQYVIHDDLVGLAYIALTCSGAVFAIAILKNWRSGVYFLFTWLLFEDFARKMLGNNMAIFFAKDILLLVVYISFVAALRRRSVETFRPPFLVPLLLFVWFGIMQVFNPASPTLLYGVLGVKLFYSYMPLFFVGYALINSETDLRRFFRVNVFLALIISALGIAQSIIGPTFLNPSAPAEEIRELSTLYRVSPVTGFAAYRATSVFVSTGRYANYLMLAWLLILAYTGYLLLRDRRGRNLAFFALAVLYGAIILGASRGLFMWTAGSVVVVGVAFIWGAPRRQREVIRVFRTMQRVALGITLALVALFFIFPDALLSRLAIYSETLMPGAQYSELQFRSWDYPFRNFVLSFDYPRWPYGYGIGTTSLGTQYVAKLLHTPPTGLGVESGFGALVVEMGIGGLILWLIMSFAILFAAWKVVKNLKGSPLFPLSFAIFWYAFLLLLPITFGTIVVYEDFVMNAYLWLMLGILFSLPRLVLIPQNANAGFSATSRIRSTR